MTSVWWPGINHEIQNMVQQCPTCAQNLSPRKQPLIPTPLPNYPWQKVVTDLFHLNGATYLLTVDYFSRYPEVQRLSILSSQAVIEALKTCFSRYGIPEAMALSTHHKNLPRLSRITTSPMSPAVLGFHRAMDRQRELSRQSRSS